METVNRYLFEAFRAHRDRPMQVAGEVTLTYADAARAVEGVAARLRERGIAPGDRVALVAENSPRWMHAYLGILAAGGVVVPRGEDTSASDLERILDHSGAKLVFTGSRRVEERLPPAPPRIPLDRDFPEPRPVDDATLDRYAKARSEEDIAVILYTSGTTGHPKGVVLPQKCIAHNLRVLPRLVGIETGDVWVSVLPPWHTFEQTVELVGFSLGCTTVYSDKRRLRDDLRKHRPHFFASVPRVWESIQEGATHAIERKGALLRGLFRACYRSSLSCRRGNALGWPLHALGRALFYRKIAAATGGRLKAAISGGGYLPPHVDEFFDAIGVTLLIGYGLTETAPVVALRGIERNVLGTIGRAVPETEIRISEAGTIQVRGPQVMRGYYRDPELTARVLSPDGWFDTGDLGRLTPEGDLVFVGRAKDTIVLSGGENVEPEPIENRLLECPLILQVMIVGQDRHTLGALVVPKPEALALPDLEARLREEFRRRTGPPGGFRSFESIVRFAIVKEEFTVENGLLTATLKMRRNPIAERHKAVIDALLGP